MAEDDGGISRAIQQTMDIHTGKFMKLIEEAQVTFEEKICKHLAELEAKWDEKWRLKQNTELARRKVADVVVISATTEDAISDQMEIGDTTPTYVLQGRMEEEIKEEEATGEGAGATCAAESDPIFSFHGDPFF